MKLIKFQESTSQKIYDDYLNRVKRTIKILNKEDSEEVLMEFNSHIYESFQYRLNNSNSELENLLFVIEKLGSPEVVLKPIVAEKKLKQAVKSFNPIHIFKALVLNIYSGTFYIVIALLYLMLFGFVFIIGGKLLYPDIVGVYFRDNVFMAIGVLDSDIRQADNISEVLGNWFIPVMLFVSTIFYLLITLLLRIKNRKNN